MTDIASTTITAEPPASSRGFGAAALLTFIVVLGDLLFWQQRAGISLALYFVVLIGGVVALNRPARFATRDVALVAVALLAVAPMIEDFSLPALAVALGALCLLGLGLTRQLPAFEDWLGTFTRFGMLAPFRLVADALRITLNSGRVRTGSAVVRTLLVWLVPAAFALIFVLLFAAANPLIDSALQAIRLDAALELLHPGRIVFWGVLAAVAWPFLAPRLIDWVALPQVQGPVRPRPESLVFGADAIRNSLIVFNAMFAVQTVLDLLYLWGGLRLPDNLTYAAYAHRGAYPLIVTALLAGAFVLVAMRRNGPGESSPLIRNLVYLWVAQNVWLVISSLLRLKLYVEQYQLSELRIAAGIWMLLVAVGLVLIVAKIALGRSSKWLVASNLAALAVTLWGVAWVDFPALISRYNVAHSSEMTGQGTPVDLSYLSDLGPGVVPALDDFLVSAQHATSDRLEAVRQLRENAISRMFDSQPDGSKVLRPLDWRAWSWRDERLRAYLAAHPFAPEPPGDMK